MGEPESLTGYSLTNPSVLSKAIVLTLESPRCYATSRINLCVVPSTSNAFKIGGKPSSNYTSTTAPITYVILPIFTLAETVFSYFSYFTSFFST